MTGTSFIGNTATGGSESEGGAVDIDMFSTNQATIMGSTFLGNGAAISATSPFVAGSAEGEPSTPTAI